MATVRIVANFSLPKHHPILNEYKCYDWVDTDNQRYLNLFAQQI